MRRQHLLALLLLLATTLLAACDFGGSSTPTPIPPTATPTVPPTATTAAASAGAMATGTPGTVADIGLINDAVTTTQSLKSYHLAVDLSAMGQVLKGEGDYSAPDRLSLTGALGPAQQIVIIGSQVYSRDASGVWTVRAAESSPMGAGGTFGIMTGADLFGTVARYLSGVNQATSLGTETVGGVALSHFRVPIFASSLMGLGGSTTPGETPLGSADVWIDPTTKYIHRVDADVDVSDLINALQSSVGPTVAAGAPTSTPLAAVRIVINMIISRHNEPVTIATPDISTPTAVVAPTEAPAAQPSATTAAAGPEPGASEVWKATAAAMNSLTSYHASFTVTGGGATSVSESDVLPPDQLHAITTISTSAGEIKTELVKATGRALLRTDTGAGYGLWSDAGDLNFGGFGLQFDAASAAYTDLKLVGDETIDGIATSHYTFSLDPAAGSGPAGATGGSGELWIAKSGRYLVRMTLNSNAVVAGMRTDVQISANYSRFNDPAIVIEEPQV